MDNPNVMSYAEIHQFGIDIVLKEIRKSGAEIESVMTDMMSNPQIVAKINGQPAFILVRTACYPQKGILENQSFVDQFLKYARSLGRKCYFASVGIANANGTTDLEMSIPMRGGEFYISYSGLDELSQDETQSKTDTMKTPVMNKDGNIGGCTERLPDGRHIIHGGKNADIGSLNSMLGLIFAEDLSEHEKYVFSKWANLPTNSWTEEHRKEFSLALNHLYMHLKTNPSTISPKFKSAMDAFPPQVLAPLRQPLTQEIVDILAGLFGETVKWENESSKDKNTVAIDELESNLGKILSAMKDGTLEQLRLRKQRNLFLIENKWQQYRLPWGIEKQSASIANPLMTAIYDMWYEAGLRMDNDSWESLGEQMAAIVGPWLKRCYYLGYEIAAGNVEEKEKDYYIEVAMEPINTFVKETIEQFLQKDIQDPEKCRLIVKNVQRQSIKAGNEHVILGIKNFPKVRRRF